MFYIQRLRSVAFGGRQFSLICCFLTALPVALQPQGAVAVELEFVFPSRSLGQFLHRCTEHRLYERSAELDVSILHRWPILYPKMARSQTARWDSFARSLRRTFVPDDARTGSKPPTS